MGIATEGTGPSLNLKASLAAGIQSISSTQTVTFTQYTKTVLSEDGYVFWVKTATSASYAGSLHVSASTLQAEDETIAVNDCIFTTQSVIDEFNVINPQTMWVGEFVVDGGTIQIAFREHGRFYEQAQVWHYVGYAVYPGLRTQIINSSADLPGSPIVSNSLPIWLSQNQTWPVYPSFLVPDNITPPYIVAHVEPSKTEALGGFPILIPPGVAENPSDPATFYDFPSSQLLRDDVRLTLYGLNNQQAIQYLVALMEWSRDTDAFGFCNSPTIHDQKRTQSEITVIAMKKTIELQASYYLGTADALARRHILSASITTTV